jgi:hypothetical protein
MDQSHETRDFLSHERRPAKIVRRSEGSRHVLQTIETFRDAPGNIAYRQQKAVSAAAAKAAGVKAALKESSTAKTLPLQNQKHVHVIQARASPRKR